MAIENFQCARHSLEFSICNRTHTLFVKYVIRYRRKIFKIEVLG